MLRDDLAEALEDFERSLLETVAGAMKYGVFQDSDRAYLKIARERLLDKIEAAIGPNQ